MLVRLTLTIDIPKPEEWTRTFGVDGAERIRRDVKRYVGEGIAGWGVFGTGEVHADITMKS